MGADCGEFHTSRTTCDKESRLSRAPVTDVEVLQTRVGSFWFSVIPFNLDAVPVTAYKPSELFTGTQEEDNSEDEDTERERERDRRLLCRPL